MLNLRLWSQIIPLIIISGMIIFPFILTLVISFWSKKGFGMVPDFTFKSYEIFLSGTRFEVLKFSIWISISSTIMMLLIAYPLAFIIATKVKQNFTRLVLFLFAAPFLVNYFIRTFSWADILARNGTINNLIVYLRFSDKPIDWLLYSDFAVYLGLISAYMPFMIFPIWLSLNGIDRRYVEASWMLGASPARTFWRVIFPLSLPGVIAAAIFGFVGAFGEVAVSKILGGTGYQLIGNAVISSLNVLNFPLAAALSSITTMLMFGLLFVWYNLFDIRLFLGKTVGRN